MRGTSNLQIGGFVRVLEWLKDNDTWHLIAEKCQEYFIKLCEMSFKVF